MPRRKPIKPKAPPLPPDEPAVIPPPVSDAPSDQAETTVIPEPVVATYEMPALNPFDAQLLKAAIAEITRRRGESLKIYNPLPSLEPFHECGVSTRLIRGSNRAGKTLGAAVEFARAVTGQDPHGKYPTKNGTAFVFGLTEVHLATVIYEKVFRPGAFWMIRDEETNDWRAYLPTDVHRKNDRRPAPPLIPSRFIKGKIVWKNKGSKVPEYIQLKNGWELYFFSSLGEIPHGQAIDLWWIDEEMRQKDIVSELWARCIDRAGKGFWSATPQAATVQFYDLHDKAAQGDPDIREFDVKLVDNPYIDKAEKDKFYNQLDDEGKRIRFHGEFALSRLTVYPEFSKIVHGWDEKNQITADWARWLAIDPGRQRGAVLFMAISPPWFSFPCVVLYDELYIKDCTAAQLGTAIAGKSSGIVYEGGVIDLHAAKVHEMAGGRTIKDQYEEAMHKAGVEFRNPGRPMLTWGSDDVNAGIERVKEWLRVQSNGHPYLHVSLARCPWFLWEIERYRNKVDPETKQPTDKPNQKNNHLMDDARYLALLGPRWQRPKQKRMYRSPAVLAMERKRQKESENDDGGFVIPLTSYQP